MLCLGIESSCDETALALVRDGRLVGSVLASQVDLHALFGGVVPEIASREHYRCIGILYDHLMHENGLSLQDVDVLAVTRGPGLLGSLLVGVAFAKGLALGADKPIIAVNHLHAHLMVAGLENELSYPLLGLLVSGGHTHSYRIDAPDSFHILGRTLDDAAGEACDKFAKMLGLPYPGGAMLDALARRSSADPKLFPRPYTQNDNLDFSFSGLKTAAMLYIEKHPEFLQEAKEIRQNGSQRASENFCHVCASYMSAISETLRIKMERALRQEERQTKIKGLIMAGGVAANTQVRAAIQDLADKVAKPLFMPSPPLCTDNAVMVAYLGFLLAQKGYGHQLDFSAIPRGQVIPNDAGTLIRPFA